MQFARLLQRAEACWELPVSGAMRVPVQIHARKAMIDLLDETTLQQAMQVAGLPGIVGSVHLLPDAHLGYGFPIGCVAAFDENRGGVVSAGGVGFDIACGVRCLLTGLSRDEVLAVQSALAGALFANVPAGMGREGSIRLADSEMSAMLIGGAQWALAHGWGEAADLARIEDLGRVAHADPDCVSPLARQRQRHEMGTLGSGNHYLEVQVVSEVHEPQLAQAMGLALNDVVVCIHCGSRGLGHQVGSDFQRRMIEEAPRHGLTLPDRALACAPIGSELGREYLGAMRAAMNCALANRQILTHRVREVFARLLPKAHIELLYDVSHNTCRAEYHEVLGRSRLLHVHRKGATRALGPGHPDLPQAFASIGQPVLVGGSMGTASYVLCGLEQGESAAFASACHGAGRAMSRHASARRWRARTLIAELAARGILVRSASSRGVAEEAPGAYKDVEAVVASTQAAGLARKVVTLAPLICIKG